ncbi:replication initiation protein [Pelagimonas varians]|uniref:replication initiation protein n=1 Tax=Pelagimonas varians TaxID=696760 RepID=UPI000D88F41A|nr:replication initiation protein [Pelagimonas varians]PYG26318.1 replication initiator protein [Pelagimonas varians]
MVREIKEYNNDKQILKKHVSAIHSVADLTALQRKLVNALLYNAYDTLVTERDHHINTRILCDMIGFDSKNTAYLKEALVGIVETVMQFDIMEDDGERSWEAMSLLTYVKVKGGMCTYRYEQSLAEKLFHPDIYSKINLSVLRSLRSSHALVLYENCNRYVGIGQTPVWDLGLFRKLMSVEGRYKEFKFLKRDVIMPAMKEVNEHSNIQVEVLTVRKGRSVAALQFTVKPNPQMALIGMDDEDEISSTAAYQALLKKGVSKTLARSWVIDYGEAYVLDKVDLTTSQVANGKIKSSTAGFLKAAIEEDFHNENAEKQKRLDEVQTAKIELKSLERQREVLKASQKAQEVSYRMHCGDLIKTVWTPLPQTQQDEIRTEFKRGLGGRIYVDAFNKHGWTDILCASDIRSFWESRGITFPSPAEWANENGAQDPQALKAQIDALDAQLKK